MPGASRKQRHRRLCGLRHVNWRRASSAIGVGRRNACVFGMAAVAFGAEENGDSQSLRRRLASWGVSRIVPPGIVGRPSMMWRHDGTPCLGKMIGWCDIEMVSPEELLTVQ